MADLKIGLGQNRSAAQVTTAIWIGRSGLVNHCGGERGTAVGDLVEPEDGLASLRVQDVGTKQLQGVGAIGTETAKDVFLAARRVEIVERQIERTIIVGVGTTVLVGVGETGVVAPKAAVSVGSVDIEVGHRLTTNREFNGVVVAGCFRNQEFLAVGSLGTVDTLGVTGEAFAGVTNQVDFVVVCVENADVINGPDERLVREASTGDQAVGKLVIQGGREFALAIGLQVRIVAKDDAGGVNIDRAVVIVDDFLTESTRSRLAERVHVGIVERVDVADPELSTEGTLGEIELHHVIGGIKTTTQFPLAITVDIPGSADTGRELVTPTKRNRLLDLQTCLNSFVGRQIFVFHAHAEVDGNVADRAPCILQIEALVQTLHVGVGTNAILPDIVAIRTGKVRDAATAKLVTPVDLEATVGVVGIDVLSLAVGRVAELQRVLAEDVGVIQVQIVASREVASDRKRTGNVREAVGTGKFSRHSQRRS